MRFINIWLGFQLLKDILVLWVQRTDVIDDSCYYYIIKICNFIHIFVESLVFAYGTSRNQI